MHDGFFSNDVNLTGMAGIKQFYYDRNDKWYKLSASKKGNILSKCMFIIQLCGDKNEKEAAQIYKVGLLLIFVFTGFRYTSISEKNSKDAEEVLSRVLNENILVKGIMQCFHPRAEMRPSLTDIEIQIFLYKNSL